MSAQQEVMCGVLLPVGPRCLGAVRIHGDVL